MNEPRAASWDELERPGPEAVEVGGVELRPGSRVVLRPERAGSDVWSTALHGRVGVVDKIEEDTEGEVQLVVVVEDDPGRDLGERRHPGHRFFFTPAEVEPLAAKDVPSPAAAPRVLVAGIGNVFLGDDGFGVALAGRLARMTLPPGVEVVDYGIRGMDLAYAMSGYDTVVLLDATPRGEAPGTLYVIEADMDDGSPTREGGAFDAHGMDPVSVIALARTLGGPLPRTLVVGCEPATHMTPEDDELLAELSDPVQAALAEGERLVLEVLDDILRANEAEVSP
jgi:hydrogenase maturation protease